MILGPLLICWKARKDWWEKDHKKIGGEVSQHVFGGGHYGKIEIKDVMVEKVLVSKRSRWKVLSPLFFLCKHDIVGGMDSLIDCIG